MDQNHFSRRQFLKRGISLTGGSVALGAIGTASAATTNSIVTENQLPGTPQDTWDLPAIAQYSGFGLGKTGVTHYIEGFADNISVNHGTTINFKINTDSKSYRIDIYRLGYYGGAGARLVNSTTMSAASVQPTPLTNAALGLVDAGNWSITAGASWAVPLTAVSGVYIAHLFRLDTSGQNHITFIVRDDGTPHDIVFQTSDPTWHAYNGWGGPSLYGNASNADARAYKVSYNRPFATRDSIGAFAGPQDFLFGAEYPAIRWLEANGYDVCYIAGVDTDRNIGGNQITARKVFLSVGHDEYWSGNQRANVEAARAAGVHLEFWSGNEVFWKTRYEASTDPSATAYRTLVCYKETKDNQPIDPLDPPTWTGSWRDPRFSPPADGGRPENALIGQIWTVDSWRADTITIPYPMTTLRFWRNTNVAKTLSGKSASLVQNILGYEWDESPDNGFRPAGLFHLSSTTLAVTQYMIDYGSTDGAYTATHAISLYRYQSSGSIVFGSGTVFWAWGLDADHDLQLSYTTDSNTVSTEAQTVNASNTPVDLNVQQAMVNLFADMGIQPLSLRTSTGLLAATKSTDTTAPVSIINAPGALKEQQIVSITGTASDTGGIVAGVEVSTDGGATWHPATGTTSWSYSWWPQEVGTFNILSRAVDDSLNLETPGPGISVTVGVGTALSLFNPSAVAPFGGTSAPATAGPSQDPSAVEVGIQFQTSGPGSVTGIRFYKNPWNTGTHVGNLWSATGTLLGSATFKSETALGWQTVMLTTPVVLTPGTMYVVSFHSTGGQYSSDDNYFATPRTSGPLRAPAIGGNSVFAYGSTSVFPSNSGGTDNYWADVIFAPSGSTGNQNPVAGNDSGFVTTTNTTLSIQASALLANDSDPNGFPLTITSVSSPTNGTVSYNTGTQTVSFVPTTGYPSPAFTGPAGFSYTISNGNGGTATATVSITVSVATSSVFSATSAPVNVTISDTSPVELGMKFQASVAGAAVGVRFYKGPKNVGTHVGNLWSSAGALLSSVTFSSETASGWQQAYFTSAPTLTAGATYTVSYHTSGFYSADANGFTNAITNGSLTAPSNASSGGNGVYAYGSTSAFPSSSFNASNYWVDIIFVASGSLGSQPPVANPDSGFVVAKNGSLTIAASALLANDTDANSFALTVTGVSNPVNGTASYNTTSQTVTFTPTANYTGPASFTYSISDGHGGTASANVSLTVSVTSSLFSPTSTPSTVTVSDTTAVELGVKFQASVAGTITGIRFYKGPQNTSTHTGNLWSSTGALLASAVFSGETASGWQQVNFSAVTLTPGTTYIASYHTNGFYSANANYFASALTNGPLTAPATTNGVYAYGSTSTFPTNSFNATNYWVDVVFNQS